MVDRHRTKKKHERAYVDIFISWFNHTYQTNFKVICEPDPPEAVLLSGKTITWMEVTTAFWCSDYARDLYSYATPGEKYKPVDKSEPHQNMDIEFSKNFVDVVKKKLEKDRYIETKELLGPGYLIVAIMHPLFDKQTINYMEDAWSRRIINDLGCFKSIYIIFTEWDKKIVLMWPSDRL